MTLGSKQYKNGKTTGKIHFDTGKTVFLNKKEWVEFIGKVRDWQAEAIDRYKADNKIKL